MEAQKAVPYTPQGQAYGAQPAGTPMGYGAQPAMGYGAQPAGVPMAAPMGAVPMAAPMAAPVMMAAAMPVTVIQDPTDFNYSLCAGCECCCPCDICCMSMWCNPCLHSNTVAMLENGQPIPPCTFSNVFRKPEEGALCGLYTCYCITQNLQQCVPLSLGLRNFSLWNPIGVIINIAYACIASNSRKSIKEKYGIQDQKGCCCWSCGPPCCAWFWCGCCAAIQEFREVRLRIGAPLPK